MNHRIYLLIVPALLGLAAATTVAQPTGPATQPAPPPGGGQYVTREEYEKLKSELDAVKRQMATSQKEAAAAQEDVDKTIDEMMKDVKRRGEEVEGLRLGTNRFIVTGYAFAGYTDRRHENSTFSAGLSPIFLWRINDRIFVEAEPELELENEEGEGKTSLHLEYADLNFILNDYMTVRAGLFLTPFGQFPERIHPAWINKLPDFPLVFGEDGGLVPFSSLGAELRGAFPVQSHRINYAVYVANGPSLVTEDPERAGSLDFDNFTDNNSNKAVGGRVGFLPGFAPGLEVGYSVQASTVSNSGSKDVNALLQAVDVSYVRQIEPLYGTIDLRAEWVWSNVDKTVLDPEGSAGFGPLAFDNKRSGGYIQAAYRPTLAGKFLRDLEFVCRYDLINVPDEAPGVTDEKRLTLGVDYWITPTAVLKAAYQFDDKERGSSQDAFLLQLGVGF